jgi:hypothetical protein
VAPRRARRDQRAQRLASSRRRPRCWDGPRRKGFRRGGGVPAPSSNSLLHLPPAVLSKMVGMIFAYARADSRQAASVLLGRLPQLAQNGHSCLSLTGFIGSSAASSLIRTCATRTAEAGWTLRSPADAEVSCRPRQARATGADAHTRRLVSSRMRAEGIKICHPARSFARLPAETPSVCKD